MVDDVTIAVMRCPHCGAELAGLDQDVVFFCRNCICGYEIGANSRFRKLSFVSQSPPENVKPSSLLWLPMWALKVSTEISASGKEKKLIKRILEDCPWVWVTAYRTWRPSYFGDPGLLYTSKSIVPEMKKPEEEGAPAGCALREIEATQYPMPFLLSIVDRHIDVASIDIHTEIIESKLVAVPFIYEGDRIKDTQMEWEWPPIFVEDIVSLRYMADRIPR